MFTRRLFPGEQRPGYELLGLLLFLQISTQAYLSLTSSKTDEDPTQFLVTSILAPPPSATRSDVLPPQSSPQVTIDLEDPDTLPYIPQGSRRCPLCLDAMKDPTSAECGHLFCWQCILRWTNESPAGGECPICRHRCGKEALLRLAG
jgi:peroxin-10